MALTRGHPSDTQQEKAYSEQAISRGAHFQGNYLQGWEWVWEGHRGSAVEGELFASLRLEEDNGRERLAEPLGRELCRASCLKSSDLK